MEIIRDFEPADRYVYDFGPCSVSNGFAQVDTSQDASYYGTWTNPTKLVTVCYCEGDVTITKCDNETEYAWHLLELKEWSERLGRWRGIDPGYNHDNEIATAFKAMGLGDLLH